MTLEELVRAHAVPHDQYARPFPRRRARDGFTMSVQVGWGNYCEPRPEPRFTPADEPFDIHVAGEIVPVYTRVECGYPSAVPEPWPAWRKYAEDPDEPTGTVYGYVPVCLVRALLDLHGGEVEP